MRLSNEKDGILKNLSNSKKRFLAKGLAQFKGQVLINKKHYNIESDDFGYFKIQNTEFEAQKKQKDFYDLKFIFEDGSSKDFPKVINNLGHAGSYGIITDIDDTVIQTNVQQRWRTVIRALAKNVFQKKQVEGAGDFLNEMVSKANCSLFYCSRSPYQMYDIINHFFELNNYPFAPMLLRNVSKESHYYQRDVLKEQKFLAMKLLLEQSGDIQFVMLGDSNEKDALIYLNLAKLFPNKVAKIFIRHLRTDRKFKKLKKEISQFQEQSKLCFFKSFSELETDPLILRIKKEKK